jgi:hypothetical protein
MKLAKILGMFALGTTLLATSPIFGTWKLNVDKSKYNSGPPPKSATITYEATADSIKRTGETIDAEGKATSFSYTAKYDGKDYPITGSDLYDSVAMKSITNQRSAATLKKSGKVVGHVEWVFSDDGKTMTLVITGKDSKGKASQNIAVYEKQ